MSDTQKSIGGYFELELPQGSEYHTTAIALNTGRNCLEYILRVRGYRNVYLPYYSCDVLLEPFKKLNVRYSFYHINECLELDEDIRLSDGEAILYINYYGLKQGYVYALATKYGKQLIVDNTQAFYAKPIEGIDTFYSCRKFFGVADGAYLYCDHSLDMELEQDQSWERMTHLLKRIDVSPEAAYKDFTRQDDQLRGNPIRTMSQLTRRIMASIDYKQVALRRRYNYRFLDQTLKDKSYRLLQLTDDEVPMIYPYYIEYGSRLRQHFIEHHVFCARYWPNILDWCSPMDWEYQLAENLVCIPIDQRYNENDMQNIISLLAYFQL